MPKSLAFSGIEVRVRAGRASAVVRRVTQDGGPVPRRAASSAARDVPRSSADGFLAAACAVRARVAQALANTEIPVVNDHEVAAAVDALFAHARGHTDLCERHEGNALIPIIDGYSPAQGAPLELFFAPHRHPQATEHKAHAPDGCPFCSPDRTLGVVSWRGRHILPNAFPYTPASSRQLLIVPAEHASQDFDRAFFADVLALQRALGPRVAMHFNGHAGNSQPHLHWHAHEERLPLERRLDSGALQLTPVTSRHGARVASYDDGDLRGILVQGHDDHAVADLAQAIAHGLERDPAVAGRFNMLLLRRRGDEARLVIVPRRADALTVTDAVAGRVNGGALDVAGRHIVEATAPPDGFVSAWRSYLRTSTVDVSALKDVMANLHARASEDRLHPVAARMQTLLP